MFIKDAFTFGINLQPSGKDWTRMHDYVLFIPESSVK